MVELLFTGVAEADSTLAAADFGLRLNGSSDLVAPESIFVDGAETEVVELVGETTREIVLVFDTGELLVEDVAGTVLVLDHEEWNVGDDALELFLESLG